jgi:hypothetical protein
MGVGVGEDASLQAERKVMTSNRHANWNLWEFQFEYVYIPLLGILIFIGYHIRWVNQLVNWGIFAWSVV